MTKTYHFSFTLSGYYTSEEYCDDLTNGLYSAGCWDGTVGLTRGQTRIDFDRIGPSYEWAVHTALVQVLSVPGVSVAQIERTLT